MLRVDAIQYLEGFDVECLHVTTFEDIDICLQAPLMCLRVNGFDVTVVIAAHVVPDIFPILDEKRCKHLQTGGGLVLDGLLPSALYRF
jgi:hypothetical protein